MQFEEVLDLKTRHEFLKVALMINGPNPHWIRPLNKDIEDTFDPNKNKAFRAGECKRWILRDDTGNLVGRVAAFVNRHYKTKGDEGPVGGIGFFECIDDQGVANRLFDQCKDWLSSKGMEAMDGPINFGERDRWWGLLVEGFHEPLYGMNHNPPYYQALFESYGFRPFFNQICFAMGVDTQLQEKLYQRHQKIAGNPSFSACHLKKNGMEKFSKDFQTIYNKAWAGHQGNKSLDIKQVRALFHKLRPMIDEELVWFVYYKEDPIACWLNMPDLNQIVRRLNGKLGFVQKLKFFWYRNTGLCNRFVGIVFGIVPEFQGTGVDSYMIIEGAKVIQAAKRYKEYEMQWIGDFNPKMINIAESLGTQRSRKLITYRYLFDRKLEFKRHPILV